MFCVGGRNPRQLWREKMFHHTNLGYFAPASRYNDANGYIAQAGDAWADMAYDGPEPDEDEWQAWVEECEAVTAKAEAAISAWQTKQ